MYPVPISEAIKWDFVRSNVRSVFIQVLNSGTEILK